MENQLENRCQSCGAIGETKYVELYQNIGVLVMRLHKSIKGRLCKNCIDHYFWEFTGKTIILGWWGVISFIVTPIFLINNLFRYVTSISMNKNTERLIPDPSPFWIFTTIGGIVGILGICVIIVIALIFAMFSITPSTKVEEKCSVRVIGTEVYLIITGDGSNSACDDILFEYPSDYQKISKPPTSPVICRQIVDDMEFSVVDTSDGEMGREMCSIIKMTISE
jgi:hypothetical protein